jgi:ATP-dependent Lon protease
LEVLDPEQNFSFTDHYIALPFDLSKILFITTANVLDTIPRPLMDRMEIIQLPGYTNLEKLEIAKRYLAPRQVKENGLSGGLIRFTDASLSRIIEEHTRESGVRELERKIGSVCRKVARSVAKSRKKKRKTITARNLVDFLGTPTYVGDRLRRRAKIGVATGLAWTSVGGKILYIEGVTMPGGNGSLRLTGQLGNVMQESASAAYSYLRSRLGEKGKYKEIFGQRDMHIHIPAGAIPKDGPSAGIAMASVMLSLVVRQPIDRKTAMTGEITLTGDVLAIGGLLEKVLAAHRVGIDRVIFPATNKPDLQEIPEEVTREINFVPVEHIDDVWNEVFPGVL